MPPKRIAIASVITGGLAMLPIPHIGWLAPIALVLALIALARREFGLGLAGIALAIVGFAINPFWKSPAPATETTASLPPAPPQHSLPPWQQPTCVDHPVTYKPLASWNSLERKYVPALGGASVLVPPPAVWSYAAVNPASYSAYYHTRLVFSGSFQEFVTQKLDIIKQNNPAMTYSRTDGQKTVQGHPIVLIRMTSLNSHHPEVVAFIDNDCAKEIHVLTSPNEETLTKDFGAFSQAVLATTFN